MSISQVAAGQFADDERMGPHTCLIEQSGEPMIPATQMIDPDGRVDQDHPGPERRRGEDFNSGSDAPNRARRRALSRSISARKPSRTRAALSGTPVSRCASSSNCASMFSVVRNVSNSYILRASIIASKDAIIDVSWGWLKPCLRPEWAKTAFSSGRWFRIWCLTLILLLLPGFASAQAGNKWLPLPAGEITRIAFGSCAKHWQPQPIWKSVIDADPDLFLFLGDAIYADTDGRTAWPVMPGQLTGEWYRLADKPEIQELMAAVPVMATWDNHDYGTHSGGAEFPLKRVSRDIFLDFFDEPAGSARRLREGVYDAKIFGTEGRRVQIILLDTRYFKGPTIRDERSKEEKQSLNVVGKYAPNHDPDVTLLGKAQWVWLAEQLKQPAELRLIASSTQIIADEKGMDEWGNYPLERQRLIDLLRDTKVNGVILLSGNVHFGEVSGLEALDYPLLEVTSSGLTHINQRYAQMTNSYRVGGPVVENNFGMVGVDWNAETGPQVTISLSTEDGSRPFAYTFALEDLGISPEL